MAKPFPVIFSMVLMLVGCAHKQVEPREFELINPDRTDVGIIYSVDPQIAWSGTTLAEDEMWTIDGPTLQVLYFINATEDGETPFFGEGRGGDKGPKFRKDMTFLEIKDLILDGLALTGSQQLNIRNLRPSRFGGHDGFRFEVNFVTKEGLDMLGMVAGAVIEEELYLIVYAGAREHYFAKYRGYVEKIIGSIQMEES